MINNECIIFYRNHYFFTLSTSQLNPSSKPSCVLAEHAVIVHVLVLICSIFKCFKIYLIKNNLLNLVEELELNLAYLRK